MNPPFLTVMKDGSLLLTVEPNDLQVCPECPNLHVRLLNEATPENLRRFADTVSDFADELEEARHDV